MVLWFGLLHEVQHQDTDVFPRCSYVELFHTVHPSWSSDFQQNVNKVDFVLIIYNETSIDQTLHQFANLLLNWTLLPILTLLPNFGGFHRTLQWVQLANRGRLLLQTPGPVPFGTCICSNVETILSWTCHVYGLFEFRTSLGTSLLLCFEECIY